MKRLLFLSLALVFSHIVCGRNYYFSHLTMNEGLSNNCVKTITQDQYGFIWIGTKNGLCRYDGSRIRVLKCHDYMTGNGNNNVNSLFVNSDKELWCGTDKGVYIWSFEEERFREFTLTTKDGTGIRDWVAAINKDKDGNIWIIVPSQGIFRYKGKDLVLYRTLHPQSLCIRKNGQVWIGTESDGLLTYNPDSDSFSCFHTDKAGNSILGEYIYSICEWGSALVLAIHDKELKYLDFKSMTFGIIDAPQVHNTLLRDIRNFDNDLWITSHEGVFIINGQSGETTHIQEDADNSYSLSDKTCSTLYKDTEGGIWVGTMLGGVNYCASENFNFDKYVLYDRSSQVRCNKVRTMTEGPDGKLWIGTEDEGMCIFDPSSGETKTLGYAEAKKNKQLNTLGTLSDGERLWFGLFKRGIGEISMKTGQIRHIDPKDIGISESSIYSFLHDTYGNIWIGTASGVYVRNEHERKFHISEQLKNFWAFDIYEDSRKNVWFASLGGGLYRYENDHDKFIYYSHDSNNANSLSSNSVSSVYEDSRGYIWCSTDRGGLNRYDYVTDSFKKYSVEDGLPDDVTYKVVEDKSGNLWFGTNNGLVKLNPENGAVRVFTKKDGLLGNQFNYHAVTKGRNGLLWFGGMDGIICFDPLQRGNEGTNRPNIFITGLEINNRRQFVGDEDAVIGTSPLFTDRIVLKHDQSNLKVEFSDVRFSTAQNTRYYYSMGVSRTSPEWVEVTGDKSVSFARLNPGNYIFRIRAVAKNGQEKTAEKDLSINVRQPWWYSTVAKILYAFILSGSLTLIIVFLYRRKKRQMCEQQHLFEVEKEKELYRSKIDFFNEIAHELRTPLTLIKGPLEDVIVQNENPQIDKVLNTISRNTDRLLELVNQLLDFRKVDANKVQMNFIQFDVVRQLNEIAERFGPVMEKQGKNFTMSLEIDDFRIIADKESFTKIVSNLLNNAVKYSECHISLEFTHDTESFYIRITSDGKKIPLHLSERIFEPFFRIDTSGQTIGTGIGLPMARSLAEMHKGRLVLDTMADNNSFVLTMPIVQEGFAITEEPQEPCIQQKPDIYTPASYSVLIVEDNIEIRNYIVDNLKNSCVVLTAADGMEALEIMREHKVDIVVTDIMMPKMDGMELCGRIKKDETLRSTPVVFITAKNDMKTKVDGLKTGAEAFIEKPFSFSYLSALIFSIMDNRRQEREEYSRNPLAGINNIKMSGGDEVFMNKFISIIEENMAESITVEWLADKTNQSPSSLLRRIKKLTGQSIPEFINLIKMKKAALLLKEGKLKITEICYVVGISSPSYFSRLFFKQFGILPKDFIKQNIKK